MTDNTPWTRMHVFPKEVWLVKMCFFVLFIWLYGISFAGAGMFTVNEDHFRTDPIALNVTKLYKVHEGEPVYLKCEADPRYLAKISYTYKDGKTIPTEFEKEPVQLYFKASIAVNNDTYLTCSLAFYKKEAIKETLRLHLIVDEPNEISKGYLGFKMNGLIPSQTKDNHYYYKFNHFEELTVSLVKDVAFYGVENCKVGRSRHSDPPIYLDRYFTIPNISHNEPVTINLNKHVSGISVTCKVSHVNRPQEYTETTLTFVYQTPDYTPFIFGLANNKILMKYKNKTSNTIQYEYYADEELSLICYKYTQYKEYIYTTYETYNQGELTGKYDSWKWDMKQVNSSIEEHDDYFKRSFELLPNVTRAVISCTVESVTTYLELIRTNTTSAPLEIVSSEATSSLHIVLGVVGAVVALCVAVAAVWAVRKKRSEHAGRRRAY